MIRRPLRPQTLSARANLNGDPRTGGVLPAIQPSTTFVRKVDDRVYARDENPTYDALEATLASLDGGAASLVFSSGMAAAEALLSHLRPGARVVAPTQMYWALRTLLLHKESRGILKVTFVDTTDLAALARVLTNADLLWLESPANPTWAITDLPNAIELANKAGAASCVDSTVATPVFMQPLSFGADFCLHSATKALNGHADLLAGVVTFARRDEPFLAIRNHRKLAGAVLGTFEAYLLLRGLRSLYARVRAMADTAQFLAEQLQPLVPSVLYPGLPTFPGHALAARQMKGGFGSMLSVRLGHRDKALAVLESLNLWVVATSLGGVESLIEHRASVEGPASGLPEDLLRLSVGLEDREDLLEDLVSAIAKA